MFAAEPAGEKRRPPHRQKPVNLVRLFPLPVLKRSIDKGIYACGFCRQVIDDMESGFRGEEKKFCPPRLVRTAHHGTVFPLAEIPRGGKEQLPFSAGIQQVNKVAILTEGEHRRGFFGDFLRRGPTFRSIAAAEDTAMLGIKQVEIPFFVLRYFTCGFCIRTLPWLFFYSLCGGFGKKNVFVRIGIGENGVIF